MKERCEKKIDKRKACYQLHAVQLVSPTDCILTNCTCEKPFDLKRSIRDGWTMIRASPLEKSRLGCPTLTDMILGKSKLCYNG
jgi:hypothetical protein